MWRRRDGNGSQSGVDTALRNPQLTTWTSRDTLCRTAIRLGTGDIHMAEPEAFAIDEFVVFGRALSIRGWVLLPGPVTSMHLLLGERKIPISSHGHVDSADVEAQFGARAQGCRFEEVVAIDPVRDHYANAELIIVSRDGSTYRIADLGYPRNQAAINLPMRFSAMLKKLPAGALLEVGSRARSNIMRRELVPDGWSYVGLDILDGPNVDIVGDAHELPALFPDQRFDAVMGFSVIEHLMMPWKFVTSLNRVLKIGALGVITSHQSWPLHDAPWDFWRFSDSSWLALFNQATGFKIISAEMGEPTYLVAQRCHPITDFGKSNIGYLASSVLFRKESETSLEWPVQMSDIIDVPYPV